MPTYSFRRSSSAGIFEEDTITGIAEDAEAIQLITLKPVQMSFVILIWTVLRTRTRTRRSQTKLGNALGTEQAGPGLADSSSLEPHEFRAKRLT
ncbi:hypothetical protein ACM43_14690 [Bradyrhizobium sp. CCBAU 45321]|nr:hypothetical protein [Bradyrhizobium sp. CCBAU 45321]